MVLLGPRENYRRMLLKASAAGIFILSGLGGLVLWPGSMSAQHGPYEVATQPLDLARCAPPGRSISANEAHPAPIVRLWYLASTDKSRLPVLLYFSGWPGTAIDNPDRWSMRWPRGASRLPRSPIRPDCRASTRRSTSAN